MKRFGIFCPPMLGHLNPMAVLGLELQRRGHTVIFFGVADGLCQLRGLGFSGIEMGAQEYPQGQVEKDYRQLGRLTGRQGFQYTIQLFQREMTMFLREAPIAIKQAQIDLLLIDQVTTLIPTVADYLKIPFVTICNAMLVNREAAIPPYSSLYPYSDSFWARLRNRWGNLQITYSTRAIWLPIIKQRRIWGLKPYANPEARFSSLAQICQFPRELDFPRQNLAPCFHYIGRFQDPAATEPIALAGPDFPFEKLEEGPLIYASLGTLQNQRPEIFHCIAQACLSLPAQLVISLGNPNAKPFSLPGNPLVVPFAPPPKTHRQVNFSDYPCRFKYGANGLRLWSSFGGHSHHQRTTRHRRSHQICRGGRFYCPERPQREHPALYHRKGVLSKPLSPKGPTIGPKDSGGRRGTAGR